MGRWSWMLSWYANSNDHGLFQSTITTVAWTDCRKTYCRSKEILCTWISSGFGISTRGYSSGWLSHMNSPLLKCIPHTQFGNHWYTVGHTGHFNFMVKGKNIVTRRHRNRTCSTPQHYLNLLYPDATRLVHLNDLYTQHFSTLNVSRGI
jgi:hypothetical protein